MTLTSHHVNNIGAEHLGVDPLAARAVAGRELLLISPHREAAVAKHPPAAPLEHPPPHGVFTRVQVCTAGVSLRGARAHTHPGMISLIAGERPLIDSPAPFMRENGNATDCGSVVTPARVPRGHTQTHTGRRGGISISVTPVAMIV